MIYILLAVLTVALIFLGFRIVFEGEWIRPLVLTFVTSQILINVTLLTRYGVEMIIS